MSSFVAFSPAGHNNLRARMKRLMQDSAMNTEVNVLKLKKLQASDRQNSLMELERLTGELTRRMPALRAAPLELRRRHLIGKLVQ
jgi:hypothetical protein